MSDIPRKPERTSVSVRYTELIDRIQQYFTIARLIGSMTYRY